MATLRELFPNADWTRLNSFGNDGDNAFRQQFWDQNLASLARGSNYAPGRYELRGNGRYEQDMGSEQAAQRELTGIWDTQNNKWVDPTDQNYRRYAELAEMDRVSDPNLRGVQGWFFKDRNDFNRYVGDLGSLNYNPEWGIETPTTQQIQQGDRYGRRNGLENLTNAALAAMTAFAGGQAAGFWGGGAEAAGSGLLGPPPLEGAPSLMGGGQSAASVAAQQALPGLTQSGLTASSGASIPGMSGGGLLGGGATGAFDTAGWQGTGINGATGTRGPLDRLMYNVRGFTNNPLGWAQNNPVDAIRGASSIYNLGSSIFGGGEQPQQRQSSKGGTQGAPTSAQPPQFYQNQTTLAQLAQLYGGR